MANNVAVNEISILQETVYVVSGAYMSLQGLYKVLPEDATNKEVEFSVEPNYSIEVNNDGIIKANIIGEVAINITSKENPSISGQIRVVVTSNPSPYELHSILDYIQYDGYLIFVIDVAKQEMTEFSNAIINGYALTENDLQKTTIVWPHALTNSPQGQVQPYLNTLVDNNFLGVGTFISRGYQWEGFFWKIADKEKGSLIVETSQDSLEFRVGAKPWVDPVIVTLKTKMTFTDENISIGSITLNTQDKILKDNIRIVLTTPSELPIT